MDKNAEEPKQPSPENWSEAAEDLVAAGDTTAAISLLETVVSRLEEVSPQSQTTVLQLSSALEELAKLYSSGNFSLKADALLSRASLLKLRASANPPPLSGDEKEKVKGELDGGEALQFEEASSSNKASKFLGVASESNVCDEDDNDDDDWEAIADCPPSELLATDNTPSVSNALLVEENVPKSKRRGRGTFSYNKDELYSDRLADLSLDGQREDETNVETRKQASDARESRYGTRHVLVLGDFPPSTRTIDLEKLFDAFSNRVAIRWVNDTTAIAVFRTPSAALEAHGQIIFPFKVRILDEDDSLIASISPTDLEPPRQRPQTSATTAQRLIAQGMGLKLSNSTSGSRELKAREEARKNRIVTRQKLIEDAWGDD